MTREQTTTQYVAEPDIASKPELTQGSSKARLKGSLISKDAIHQTQPAETSKELAAVVDDNSANSQVVINTANENSRPPSFSSLTPKLRMMIWDASLCDGRVVVLYHSRGGPEIECALDKGTTYVWLRPHVLCEVTQNSRDYAMKSAVLTEQEAEEEKEKYKPGAFPVNPRQPDARPLFTWMDPVRDWLCIEPLENWPVSSAQDNSSDRRKLTHAVRNLAIIDRSRSPNWHKWLLKYIFSNKVFRNTKTLAFVRNIITLHAPPGEVWAAGILHRGDSHVLVDITDTSSLRRVYEFYLKASRRRHQRSVELLKMLIDPRGCLAYETRVMDDMKDGWLLAQYHQMSPDAARRLGLSRGLRRLPGREKWDYRRWQCPDQASPRSEYYICIGRARDELLQAFPKFNLMIMFRICNAKICDASRQVPNYALSALRSVSPGSFNWVSPEALM
ncbi:hypothetical protein ONZ43_g2777 [Nemania bipapillata]|uniref:Uncharacterized protein n=1 Tax=Nemania bipapillata TaxID=110536 RepID=A0ACC2IZA8_9PEZI|nr:hypothetical protein ONZ43_g2777 [Nemania bipapillata]